MHSISSRLLEYVETDGDRTFCKIWAAGETDVSNLRYRDIVGRAKQVAGLLAQRGVAGGSVVIIMLPTSAALLESFLGGILNRSLPSIFPVSAARVHIELLVKNLTHIIDVTRPAALITTDEIKRQFFGDADIPVRVLTPDDWAEMPHGASVVMPDPSELAFLQHSSGTTGLKKGVAISHVALINQIDAYARSIELTSADKIACWLPLYHDMGLITGLFLPLLTKTPVLLMDAFDWVVDPARFLKIVSDERATLCWLPNFSYLFMADKVPDARLQGISLASLRALVNCSEPITADAHERFLKRYRQHGLDPSALTTCYAMAENTFAVTQSQLGRPPMLENVDLKTFQETGQAAPARDSGKMRAFVSSGTPIDGTSIRIVDERGSQVRDRQVGEIAIHSNCMLSEYFERPDLSAEAIQDGWYMTGDYGFKVDRELFVTGRKSDMIILSGKNIYPQDVEEIVADFSAVRSGRVVAFGVFNEEAGTEELVVLAESANGDDAPLPHLRREIERAIAQRLECTVSHLRLLPPGTLVKSTSGKISRNGCRELWLSGLNASEEQSGVTAQAALEAPGVKGFELAYTSALVLEIVIQVASLLAPAALIRSSLDSTLLLTVALVVSFYLYSLGVLLFSGLLVRMIPKPAAGLVKSSQDAFRWALLATLARFNRRTPAQWLAWIFPFPGHWFYRLCGAQIHPGVRLGSSETLLADPYFLHIDEGTIVGHAALVSGHYVRDAKLMQLGHVSIGRDVLIGSGATIWPNVSIGDGAIVQERAAVMPGSIIPAGEIWGGSPAQPILRQLRDAGPQVDTAITTQGGAPPTEEAIRADILRFFSRFDTAPLSDADFLEPVVDSGVINSLHFIELISELENRYSVRLLDEKLSVRNLSLQQLVRRVLESR